MDLPGAGLRIGCGARGHDLEAGLDLPEDQVDGAGAGPPALLLDPEVARELEEAPERELAPRVPVEEQVEYRLVEKPLAVVPDGVVRLAPVVGVPDEALDEGVDLRVGLDGGGRVPLDRPSEVDEVELDGLDARHDERHPAALDVHPLGVDDDEVAVCPELQDVGLDVARRLARAGAADDEDVAVVDALPDTGTGAEGDAEVLGQDDVVVGVGKKGFSAAATWAIGFV